MHISKPENKSYQGKYSGKIAIDKWGIPNIEVKDDVSSAYFLGWMHGKDRRFQMEMIRRTVQGRLAEIVGQKALPSDLFWRKFQFEHKAKIWFQHQPKSIQEIGKAYANGINDQQHDHELELEFYLLDFIPQNADPWDMYYLLRYMDYALNYDESTLAFQNSIQSLPESVRKTFYPDQIDIHFPILSHPAESKVPQNETNKLSINSKREWIESAGALDIGSNNWAISKNKMNDASAALGNDPHLKLQLPNYWYEVLIKTSDLKLSGFTIPGAPFIISGNNQHLAWGITNATWSLTHFYPIEKTKNHSITIEGKTLPIQTESETIEVKGGKSISVLVEKNQYGVCDTINGKKWLIRWVGNASESNETQAFFGLEHAKNIEEGASALQYYGHPPQNFVLADAQGNILQMTAGFMGNVAPHFYDPWVKGQEIYFEKNPSRGYVFSANQAQSAHPSIHQLSRTFAAEGRAKGISNHFSSIMNVSKNDLLKIQTNTVDQEWVEYKSIFLSNIPQQWCSMKSVFEKWDGQMNIDLVQPTIFLVIRALAEKLLIQRCLGRPEENPHPDIIKKLLIQHTEVSGAYGSVSIKQIWTDAMKSGLDSLSKKLGTNWHNWSYNKVNKGEVKNITQIPSLGLGSISFSGSPRSINVNRMGKNIHGASMRQTTIFYEYGMERLSINFGGQSGSVFSINYSDQLSAWQDGKYKYCDFKHFKPIYHYEFHP